MPAGVRWWKITAEHFGFPGAFDARVKEAMARRAAPSLRSADTAALRL